MKPFLTLILTLAFSLQGFSTPQSPERLIYKGDTLRLFGYPLDKHPNIDSLRFKMFGKKDYWGCGSTACGNSYLAEWTIIDNQLYLTNIYLCCETTKAVSKDSLKFLFGEKYVNGKVKADWVTGNLYSPRGKRLFYNHDIADGGTFEYELEFYFIKGKLAGTKLYDNRKAKQSEYHDWKLIEYIYNNINWDILPKLDAIVRVVVEFSANENGIIDSVKVLRGYNKIFDQEAIRVIKSIPEWDVYFRKGKHVRMPWNMPITFSEENRLKYKKESKNN